MPRRGVHGPVVDHLDPGGEQRVQPPVNVAKRQRRLTDVDAVAIALYAKEETTGEIPAQFAKVYGAPVSTDTVSRITGRVVVEMQV